MASTLKVDTIVHPSGTPDNLTLDNAGNVTIGNNLTVTGTTTQTGQTLFPDGTAAAPAISNTGDTNTGIFFPDADTIGFSEGGVESMRIDASGNLGLGVTPISAASIRSFEIGINGNGIRTNTVNGNLNFTANGTNAGNYAISGYAGYFQYNVSAGAYYWYQYASGSAGAALPAPSQAMTIDTYGSLLVGTATSPTTTSGLGTISTPGTVQMGSSFKRNRFINGNMQVDQRNSGAAVTLNNTTWQYTLDRWAGLVSASTATVTIQRVSVNSNGFQFGLRLLRGSGTYTNNANICQVIESVNTSDLAGKTITISYWARKGSASTGTFFVQLVSGTGTDQGLAGAFAGTWTGWVSVGTNVPTLTTTLAQYTATFTVPAGSNELAVFLVVQGYTGTGSANDYIDITGVQFEEGSVATPYERQIYSDQLAQCQRYYYRTSPGAVSSQLSAFGSNYSTTAARFVTQFPVEMRIAPTALEQSGTAANYAVSQAGIGQTNCSVVPIFNTASTEIATITFQVASGLTQFNTSTAITSSASGQLAYLGWSAEL